MQWVVTEKGRPGVRCKTAADFERAAFTYVEDGTMEVKILTGVSAADLVERFRHGEARSRPKETTHNSGTAKVFWWQETHVDGNAKGLGEPPCHRLALARVQKLEVAAGAHGRPGPRARPGAGGGGLGGRSQIAGPGPRQELPKGATRQLEFKSG